MAKIHLKRLKTKYDFAPDNVAGANYKKLIRDILEKEQRNVSHSVARLSEATYIKQIKSIKPGESRLVLPNISDVLPKKSIFIKKAAQDGTLITDALRDKLTGALRNSLKEFKTKFKDEPAFIRRAGPQAGTINPKVIDLFERKIKKVYENYTKIDSTIGMPTNIKQIATTEIRFAINPVKQKYNEELLKRNPGAKMKKRWRQNKMLAKIPREGHALVNGLVIDLDKAFNVPLIINGKKRGSTKMMHPHDLTAPAEQVISCNCDIEYFIEV